MPTILQLLRVIVATKSLALRLALGLPERGLHGDAFTYDGRGKFL